MYTLKTLATLICAFIASVSWGQIYVSNDAVGANDGTSWENAFTTLEAAIDNWVSGEIWIEAGIYYPTSGMNRAEYFEIKDQMKLYGGFDGTETNLEDRNPTGNITRLSGDIGTPLDYTDNSYHVVAAEDNGASEGTIIDGLSIEAGYADDNSWDALGGGFLFFNVDIAMVDVNVFNSYAKNGGSAGYLYQCQGMLLENVYFESNTHDTSTGGGALYSTQSVDTQMIDCSFVDNHSNQGGGFYSLGDINLYHETVWFDANSANIGGAMLLSGGSATIVDGFYVNNFTTTGDAGGVRLNNADDVEIIDSYFLQNISAGDGGGFNAFGSTAVLENCQFHNNVADDNGGAISVATDSHVTMYNTQMHGNSANSGGAVEAGGLSTLNMHGVLAAGNEATFYPFARVPNSTVAFTHATITDNTAINSGTSLFYIQNTTIDMHNSIMWNNGVENFSAIVVIWGDMDNILTDQEVLGAPDVLVAEDPLFVDPADGDYHLQAPSPALNMGDDQYTPAELTTDLDAEARIQGVAPDLGAYESAEETETCLGDFNGDGTINTGDLLIFLMEFGCTSGCSVDMNGDDLVNVDDLLEFLIVYGGDC